MRTNPYLSTDGTIRESRLVQRLTKPRRGLGGTDNPFSFGGGLKNGGLSDDAMDLLRDCSRLFAAPVRGAIAR